MSGCSDMAEVLCGCCAGITRETPERITNRPALTSIAYRVGRYATFNASLLADLTAAGANRSPTPLSFLRSRDPADFSIALLDGWAVVLDILTFYQERLANEAYLRTALDQRSVFELSRLIGYVPSPGVAASTVLAFTLSSAAGSPDNVLIPAGTRVQSVPGPGQIPQVFETAADLTALIDYNALRARTTLRWTLTAGDTQTWIAGTANNINVGDVLLFVAATGGVPVATGPGAVHYVVEVATDAANGRTRLAWQGKLGGNFSGSLAASQVAIYVFRKKAALYGAQAPNASTLPTSATGVPGKTNGGDWNYWQYKDNQKINLDASVPGLSPTADTPQWLVLTGLGYTSYFQVIATAESNPNLYTLTTKTTQLTLAFGQILTGDTALSLDEVLWNFTGETRDITAYVQSQRLTPTDLPDTTWSDPYALAAGMLAPVANSTVTVKGGQRLTPGQPVGIAGRRVRLAVSAGANAQFIPAEASTALSVADEQIFLLDAYPPTTAGGGSPMTFQVLTLSGVAGSLNVPAAAAGVAVTLLPADPMDPVVGEATEIAAVAVNGDYNMLGLVASLRRAYDAGTATVNANAVMASNGETQQELLGSGAASNGALQFTLQQSPLTYVTAPTGNGTQSTLEVWVNNLRWHEVSNLLAAGPADRVFVTRVNPSGNVIVQFGNGLQGARTPTGQTNIRAVYRKGIGRAGMVAAGQLSQPMDRPQGLKSVTNPSPASGGADAATADQARRSAPLPTLTIGRVVSLEDYQDFALNFGGIAKASAIWTRFSGTRGVFLTLAGAGGAAVNPGDAVALNLVKALRGCGNPFVPILVASYTPAPFRVAANLKVDQPNYDPDQVLADVWQALSAAYAFDRRRLGQPVAAGEIIEVMQQVPGVIALQLQALFIDGTPTGAVPAQLCAAGPMQLSGTELLLLDPASQGQIGVWS